MRKLRLLVVILGIALVTWLGLEIHARITYEPEPWLEDLDRIEAHLAQTYANLDWANRTGRVRPAVLDAETRDAIRDASTDAEAGRALQAFIAAFGDPHLRIETPSVMRDLERWWRREGDEVAVSSTPSVACDRLGYEDDAPGFGVDFESVDGFHALADAGPGDPFPAGVLEVDGHRVGVLRIESFGVHPYRPLAEDAWRSVVSEESASSLESRLFQAVCDSLLARLQRRLEQLEDAKIDALVVDISGNGGGTDWVDPAARMLTGSSLSSPRIAEIRHTETKERFERWRVKLLAEAEAAKGTSREARVARAIQRVSQCLGKLEPPDRAPIWSGAAVEDLLLGEELYTSGVFPSVPLEELEGAADPSILFGPARFDYRPGCWTGPLAVLIDSATASASEHFAAMLRDGEAATLIGERTMGAGCGYIDGGHPLDLERGWTLHVPNGTRQRRDGRYELEGIEPDLKVTAPRRDIAGVMKAIRQWLKR
ncbi:MAG: S41 family peptidase [Planctomycetota bacterium]